MRCRDLNGLRALPWQNDGELERREKVAAVSHIEPWEWVRGVGPCEEDFQKAIDRIDDGLAYLMMWSILGAMAAIVVCGQTWSVAGAIARPLIRTMDFHGLTKAMKHDHFHQAETVLTRRKLPILSTGSQPTDAGSCFSANCLTSRGAAIAVAPPSFLGPPSLHLEPSSPRRKPAQLTTKRPAKDCPVPAHP